VRFPNLQEKVKEFVINLLRDYVRPLKTFISDLVSIELAYINTNHPDFFGGGQTAIMLIERLNNRNQPQINSQLPQQQNYTVTGRQPISQTNRTQPPPPKQIPQETMNQVLYFTLFFFSWRVLFFCCTLQNWRAVKINIF
jgi:hypothetical protein